MRTPGLATAAPTESVCSPSARLCERDRLDVHEPQPRRLFDALRQEVELDAEQCVLGQDDEALLLQIPVVDEREEPYPDDCTICWPDQAARRSKPGLEHRVSTGEACGRMGGS
jgi:hypothetical protein